MVYSPRLADHLTAARHRRFVGREPELAEFTAALASPQLPYHVLHAYGPGGVGKTTLLGEFALRCERSGIPCAYLDARNVDARPDAFLAALALALGLPPGGDPFAQADGQPRRVILIDTFEALAPLERWLGEVCLPQLSDRTLVVVASRHPPSAAWRSDPGWQSVIRLLPLRNLSLDDAAAYLARRDVPAEQRPAVLEFTRGHPLALSLVADAFAQRPTVRFQPEDAPDVVKALLEQFIQDVPGPAHREALEVCALVRLTTESLLAEALGVADAHALFEWLRGLSFVESGRQGLFPHDLAREALDADLRWRNPDRYAELHRRARAYYTARFQQAHGIEQQRILFDYIFLHRENPVVRPHFEWTESGGFRPEPLRPNDRPEIVAMVERHEGAESARLVEYWLSRQPRAFVVFAAPDGRLAGFLAFLGLHLATPDDLAVDPAVAAGWRFLQETAPLRPGENATYVRFWMARDTYQAVSSVQSHVFVNSVRHYLTTPGLAYHFFPCADPSFWRPAFTYADLIRLADADFAVGGRNYGVYGHDWRAMPPLAWLELLAEREIGAEPVEAPPPPTTPLLVLGQSEFEAAVQAALRDYPRPQALRTNPLLRSRLIVERCRSGRSAGDKIQALQAVLREAAEELRQTPRDEKLYRAIHRTYLQPAATQEDAAELLDVPFSTFRRHLRSGVTRIAELLWSREVGQVEV